MMSIFVKYVFGKKSLILLMTILLTSTTVNVGQAQVGVENILFSQRVITDPEMIEGNRPPSIAQAGILNSDQDHFFDINKGGLSLR